MKKVYFVLACFISLLTTSSLKGQLNLKNSEPEHVLDSMVRIPDNTLTSGPTLNVFFANKLSTYLTEASDLSLSKAYAVLDNADGRLFIGGTFNRKSASTDRNLYIFTAGVKVNVKDGFANILEENSLNNDIGLSIKGTLFGRGKIFFDKDSVSQKNNVGIKRVSLQYKLLNDFDRDLTIEKTAQTGQPEYIKTISKFVEDRAYQVIDDFTKSEADYISTNRLFNLAHSWWISFDAYGALTKSQYDVTTKLSDMNFSMQNYRPHEFNVVYTNLWDKNKWCGNFWGYLIPRGTSLLTFKLSIIGNNSVLASHIDAYSFDKYLRQTTVVDTMFLAKLKTSSVYVGDFSQFLTPQLSGRYVYFPCSFFIGISAALEKKFGKVDDLNWKLGLPVSLKDKEGKAKVNFELVWKEYARVHSFGLSVGLPLGNNIF